jgi:hypothetical protein
MRCLVDASGQALVTNSSFFFEVESGGSPACSCKNIKTVENTVYGIPN